jgi:hypothetical protein
MDLMHWLGFCPCSHSHLDLKEVVVGLVATGTTGIGYILYRGKAWLSTFVR